MPSIQDIIERQKSELSDRLKLRYVRRKVPAPNLESNLTEIEWFGPRGTVRFEPLSAWLARTG